jgi:hypothetical protein
MNPPKLDPGMSAETASQDPSTAFMIVLFAVAIAVGVGITYFGITGAIGGPIP